MKWRFVGPEADAAGFISVLQSMVRDRRKSVRSFSVGAPIDDHLVVDVGWQSSAGPLIAQLAEYYGGVQI